MCSKWYITYGIISLFECYLDQIISGKRRITPETDVLLCHFFEVELGHFAKLQLEYDLILAERSIQQKLTEIPTLQDTVKSKV